MNAMCMNAFSPLCLRVASFRRDERGTAVTEFVIILPILLWTMIATYSSWDVYRSMNRVQKATYTVVDNLTREPGKTTKAYVDGLGKLLEYLIDGNQNARLRITSVRWVASNNRYEVMWSCSPGKALPQLKTADLVAYKPKLPTLVDLEALLLFETEVPYKPLFGEGDLMVLNTGINSQTFRQFVTSKPRFIGQIELDPSTGCN